MLQRSFTFLNIKFFSRTCQAQFPQIQGRNTVYIETRVKVNYSFNTEKHSCVPLTFTLCRGRWNKDEEYQACSAAELKHGIRCSTQHQHSQTNIFFFFIKGKKQIAINHNQPWLHHLADDDWNVCLSAGETVTQLQESVQTAKWSPFSNVKIISKELQLYFQWPISIFKNFQGLILWKYWTKWDFLMMALDEKSENQVFLSVL